MKIRRGYDRRLVPRPGYDRRGDGPTLVDWLVMLAWAAVLAIATYFALYAQ
jgi:hypothetical protein